MKHNFNITLTIVLLFFLAQIFGLVIINGYIDHQTTVETGNITYTALPMNLERPEVEESISYVYIITAVLIATAIVYVLFKFKKTNWWRTWFFLAVFLGLTIAFNVFIGTYIAATLALILAFYKVFRQNIIVHNITELFIYGGISSIFVPIMNLKSIAILLILISTYDMIAVWQSKHMIKLAKFQIGAKAFAGLSIPYSLKKGKAKFVRQIKKTEKNMKKVKVKSAVLGGGDIIFPLIFAGVILKTIMLTNTYLNGFLKTLTIPIFVSIALLLLLIKAKKDKFYPAMPFLSLGCLAGFLVMLIFGWV